MKKITILVFALFLNSCGGGGENNSESDYSKMLDGFLGGDFYVYQQTCELGIESITINQKNTINISESSSAKITVKQDNGDVYQYDDGLVYFFNYENTETPIAFSEELGCGVFLVTEDTIGGVEKTGASPEIGDLFGSCNNSNCLFVLKKE